MGLEITVLYSKKKEPELRGRLGEIKTRLNSLQAQGTIESYDTLTWPETVILEEDPTRGGLRRWGTKRFRRYQDWARREGVGLGPEFKELERTDRLGFPSLYLEAKSNRELKGVFPCIEKATTGESYYVYTIEDYLTALEVGEDWRSHRPSSPRKRQHTVHDRIQAWLADAPEQYLEEWEHLDTEYSLLSASPLRENARVDLVFKRADGSEQYLLVEVKPSREKVDKALGQLLRYRYAFADQHTTPRLSPENIELAIAVPAVDEYHQQAATDLGIRVIQDFAVE